MKLPSVKPSEENVLCKNKEEFGKLIKRTIERSGSGAFFKVLGKSTEGAYYATLLIDDEKILAVEVQDVKEGTTLVGRPAMELLGEILENGPVIADAFPLDDVNVKMSVVDNIDVYNSTPKVHLSELCPTFSERLPVERENHQTPKPKPAPSVAPVEEPKSRPKPKPRIEFILEVPPQIEPYARSFANKIIKYAKSLGVEVSKIRVGAKEVRYALGAGTGVHSFIEIEGSSKSSLPYRRLKEELERFTYKEASELSEALGKKVVVSNFSLRL